MRKTFITIAALALMVACGGKTQKSSTAPAMQTSADSMSYVMGMNIGRNLMGIDSMLNIDMVAEGMRDAYRGEARLTDEEARMAYLKYMNYDNYERIKAFEDSYFEEIRRADRKFVATTSGLTYKVVELGDLKRSVHSNRDTMLVRYRMLDMSGAVLDTTYLRADTLRTAAGDMPKGVIEAVKLIGKGGHIEAWVPSQLGYGANGCDSLGVKPNSILYYEMWLVDVEK
ncbi:MAG: FKBP-type peptidyl-prolyl cis-trans isomerase [Alistipes sp.]|jgi:FKBP-type peptidyl-prolyl cis-trans isomerase FkpA|nr:FKBP-type peptidyl-prolyl cis-trans isomerase [Alistipes sp.]